MTQKKSATIGKEMTNVPNINQGTFSQGQRAIYQKCNYWKSACHNFRTAQHPIKIYAGREPGAHIRSCVTTQKIDVFPRWNQHSPLIPCWQHGLGAQELFWLNACHCEWRLNRNSFALYEEYSTETVLMLFYHNSANGYKTVAQKLRVFLLSMQGRRQKVSIPNTQLHVFLLGMIHK